MRVWAAGMMVATLVVAMDLASPLCAAEAPPDEAERTFVAELEKLDWVRGPATVDTVGNSTLEVPEGYLFLDQKNTDRFLELTHNLKSGTEMMVAPTSLQWSAYISFDGDGYVKDDEKIDAPALLESLQQGTEASNAERRKRGWGELHVAGWAIPPAYNGSTRRLEWATRLRSDEGESTNFFTKILGRRGYTTVVLVSAPEDLPVAQGALNQVLTGYRFKPGETYAEFVPGDKVAEYGLAALVLGGAAAVATKKGLWGVIGAFLAATWKLLAGVAVAAAAGLRRLFARKTT